jgi:hypothetical protein
MEEWLLALLELLGGVCRPNLLPREETLDTGVSGSVARCKSLICVP